MEIEWLEDFLALSTTLNFTRAAEMRNVTQPTFSRRIQCLELWLGVPLVDRSTFPITLTEEGKGFRRTAEETVQTLYRERDNWHRLTRHRRSLITFATLHTIAVNYFPDWIAELEAEFGRLRTRVYCAPIHDCVASLNSNGCDFMLCYFHPSGPLLLDGAQYPSLRIAQERLVPVSVPDASGAPLYSLDGTGEAAVPYLDYGPQAFIIKLVKTILANQPRVPALETVFESGLVFALKAMVLRGRGVTWLPETAVSAELASGELVYAGSPSWMTKMDLRLYRSTKPLPREAERFWSFVAKRSPPTWTRKPGTLDE